MPVSHFCGGGGRATLLRAINGLDVPKVIVVRNSHYRENHTTRPKEQNQFKITAKSHSGHHFFDSPRSDSQCFFLFSFELGFIALEKKTTENDFF